MREHQTHSEPIKNISKIAKFAVIGIALSALAGCGAIQEGKTSVQAVPVQSAPAQQVPGAWDVDCEATVTFQSGDTFFRRPLDEARETCSNLSTNDALYSAQKAGVNPNQIIAGNSFTYKDFHGE